MPALSAISNWLSAETRALGFDLAGVSPAGDFLELEYFPIFVDSGHAGDMRYLEARTEAGELKRASLRRVAPWAKSVIVCALNYNTAHPYSTQTKDPAQGWISRYAWGQADYHDVIMPKLRALEAKLHEYAGECRVWSYVDTGPLVERVFAKYAGIGWIGKNTCVINQQLGSWLFLGVVLTSLALEPSLPAPDRCGTCTRCLDACPTDAFVGPYKLDASRCISYLTIEKRGTLPEELREGMGRHVFGCDICQDVCPWNRHAAITTATEFQPRPGLVNPDLEWLARMSLDEFRSTFRGSPIKRTKLSGLRRNSIIAMGNSGDPRFLPLLKELTADPDPVIAEHSQWALKRLRSRVETPQPAST